MNAVTAPAGVDARTIGAWATIASPVVMLASVGVLKLGWKGRTDLDWLTAIAIWTTGHVLYIAGLLLTAVALVLMYGVLRARLGTPGASIAAKLSVTTG